MCHFVVGWTAFKWLLQRSTDCSRCRETTATVNAERTRLLLGVGRRRQFQSYTTSTDFQCVRFAVVMSTGNDGATPAYLEELCVPVENVRGDARLRSASTGCIHRPEYWHQLKTVFHFYVPPCGAVSLLLAVCGKHVSIVHRLYWRRFAIVCKSHVHVTASDLELSFNSACDKSQSTWVFQNK